MFGDLTCGVDLLLIERFQSVLERHPERFPKRILTDRERDYCRGRLAVPKKSSRRFYASDSRSLAP